VTKRVGETGTFAAAIVKGATVRERPKASPEKIGAQKAVRKRKRTKKQKAREEKLPTASGPNAGEGRGACVHRE